MTKVPPSYCSTCNTHNGKHAAGCAVAFPPPVPIDEVAVLRAKVAAMRELGVLEADGIKLGPAPQPPKKEETPEEYKMRVLKERQKVHDIMFAASATKPRLVKP